jgi:UDP-N-acetylglucosamine acyltransferase
MANRIHPTAVLDPSVELGEDVEIGPYCVLHAGVRLGDGCRLQNHVTLAGPLVVGRENRFFAFASVGQQSQDLKYRGEPTYCEIGDGNTFREFVTVHRSTGAEDRTVIGNRNHFLAYVHIAHDCKVGDDCIFSNNGTLGGHVVAGNHVILGGLSAVHQFCRIGDGAMTGGCTKIVQDVPPHMIADGNPAAVRSVNVVGMQRSGYSEPAVRAMKEAHRLLYRKDLNVSQALDEIRALTDVDGLLERLVAFVESSQRGIVR